MSFAGKQVLSLESRRASETAELIRRAGGEAFVAPSMREVPLAENREAFDFAQRLFAGEFDMAILLTGVGTRFLAKVIASRYPIEQFSHALAGLVTIARGPKPSAALRELGITPTIVVPEPNTWHEILEVVQARRERQIAIQEYGTPSTELQYGLRALGAQVTAVRVYQYALPENLEPLREAARKLAAGAFDVTLWTTSTQLIHLLEVAEQLGIAAAVREGVRKSTIASIGPTTSATLVEYGFQVAMEPSHPKLGMLVKEASERA